MRIVLLALLLPACAQDDETPRERIPVMGPYGYYKAIRDKEACAQDPACVCGLHKADRPEFLIDPITGEHREYSCTRFKQ